jgi:hypothetical protein
MILRIAPLVYNDLLNIFTSLNLPALLLSHPIIDYTSFLTSTKPDYPL